MYGSDGFGGPAFGSMGMGGMFDGGTDEGGGFMPQDGSPKGVSTDKTIIPMTVGAVCKCFTHMEPSRPLTYLGREVQFLKLVGIVSKPPERSEMRLSFALQDGTGEIPVDLSMVALSGIEHTTTPSRDRILEAVEEGIWLAVYGEVESFGESTPKLKAQAVRSIAEDYNEIWYHTVACCSAAHALMKAGGSAPVPGRSSIMSVGSTSGGAPGGASTNIPAIKESIRRRLPALGASAGPEGAHVTRILLEVQQDVHGCSRAVLGDALDGLEREGAVHFLSSRDYWGVAAPELGLDDLDGY